MLPEGGLAMSMFVKTVSAYQQMQDWRSSQGSINSRMLGSPGTTDVSGDALASISSNMYANQATLAGQAALARVQKKVAAATGTAQSGPEVARARGAAILSSLGMNSADLAAAYRTSRPSSANGPYKAPTNPATGKSFAQTTGNAVGALGAVNLLT